MGSKRCGLEPSRGCGRCCRLRGMVSRFMTPETRMGGNQVDDASLGPCGRLPGPSKSADSDTRGLVQIRMGPDGLGWTRIGSGTRLGPPVSGPMVVPARRAARRQRPRASPQAGRDEAACGVAQGRGKVVVWCPVRGGGATCGRQGVPPAALPRPGSRRCPGPLPGAILLGPAGPSESPGPADEGPPPAGPSPRSPARGGPGPVEAATRPLPCADCECGSDCVASHETSREARGRIRAAGLGAAA